MSPGNATFKVFIVKKWMNKGLFERLSLKFALDTHNRKIIVFL
jgi:hypothetical protein